MRKVVFAGSCALLAGVVWALVAPQQRLWGLHFLSYYPVIMRVVLFGLAALMLVMGFSRVRWRGLLPELPKATLLSPQQGDIILALACGVLFVLFSSATALLGDGQLWLNDIQAGTSDYLRDRAPLTLFLLHTLYGWLNPLTGIGAVRLFALTSAVAGTLAVLGWLKLARYLHMRRVTGLLFGFAWGGVALFFGYIETYVMMTAVVTWAMVLMIISLREDKPSWFVPVLSVLAVGFNLAAVVFLPAIVVYLWRMLSGRPLKPRRILWFSFLVIALALIAYFVFGWYRGTDVLLPLMPTEHAFGDYVFSLRHLADLANGFLLGAGAFIVLLMAFFAVERKGGFRWDDEKLVLLLALLFPLAACIMHNPQLGMARDWDICAVLLVTAPVASLVCWDAIQPFVDSSSRAHALLAAWLLVMIIPWIGVQASESRAVERFRDLLRLDPEKSETGWDYLSSYYFHGNRVDEWGQCNIEALRYSDNPRHHANAALFFSMKRDWPNAKYQAGLARVAVMTDSVLTEWEANVTDPSALIALGNSYERHSDIADTRKSYVADARQSYEVAALLQPDSPWPVVASADLFLKLRNFEDAQKAIGSLAAKGKAKLEPARQFFASLSEKNSTEEQLTGLLGVGLILQVKGDSAAADQRIRKALSLAKDEKTRQFVSQMQRQSLPASP